MRISALLVLAIALIACAGSLPFSRPGVLDTPDAYVLEHTEVQAELAASAYSVEDSAGSSNSEFMVTGHLDIGLFRYGQIGVSYLGEGGLAGNIKVAILHEGIGSPAFAIGLENMTGEEQIECFKVEGPDGEEIFYPYRHDQNWSAYGVVSKDMSYLLGIPVTASLGIGIGRFVGVIEEGALGIGSSIGNGIFGSVVVRPTDGLSISMEQDGRDLNFGASYDINEYIGVQFAWAELEQAVFPPEGQDRTDVMQNSKVTIGVTSTFGPLFGADRLALEREQQRIERARQRLQELEDRRRAAEAELQVLQDLLENR